MKGNDNDILIGVDAGTSMMKCVAFTAQGELLTMSSIANEYISIGDDCVEQDMHLTRDKVLNTLTELVSRLGDAAKNVKSVSLTGQGDGTWLVDNAGTPVHNAMLWLDSRAANIATEFENHPDYSRLFQLTGTAINASQMRTQMLWLERNDPGLLDKSASCFHCKDYLYFLLTGQRVTDVSEALFTFGDMRNHCYSGEVISLLGLSHRADLLPPIVDGLSTAAPLLPTICKQTGLPSTAQVNLASVDVICSALGGGLCERGAGEALTLLGTTGVHMRYTGEGSKLKLPEDQTGYSIVFPGGGYAQLQSNMSATMNIDWLLNIVIEAAAMTGNTIDEGTLLAEFDSRIGDAKVASSLYQPYISTAGERGPFFNANARAGFVGIDQHTQLVDIARSVYEGICFAARDCYDDLGELPADILVSGGGAKSSSLIHIFASVMNRPVRLVEREESGAAGAAMIAAVQQGYYQSVDSCVEEWVSPYLGPVVEPTPNDIEIYQQFFPVYKSLRKDLSPVWQQLAEVRQLITKRT